MLFSKVDVLELDVHRVVYRCIVVLDPLRLYQIETNLSVIICYKD